MSRNIVKLLDKGFSDISAGEKMLISSPEKLSEFIFKIPKGSYLSIKELRRGLALKTGADNTCPVTTYHQDHFRLMKQLSSTSDVVYNYIIHHVTLFITPLTLHIHNC